MLAKWMTGTVICIGLMALGLASAAAWTVQPMRIELNPAGGANSGSFSVSNTGPEALPVEIVVLRRVMDLDGNQSFEPAESAFSVFPPQAVIQPGSSQAFRFQFLGAPQVSNAEAYVIDVREVPVRLDGRSGIVIAYNFGVAVYVEPPNARSRLQVESAAVDGDGTLSVLIANNGNAYGRLTNDRFVVRQGERRIDLEGPALAESVSNPLVPPSGRRRLTLAMDQTLTPGPAEVELIERPD